MEQKIKDDFNIVWYILCWNEMPILPFMIDYWKQIARKVILFDNNSTDGTLEYLKAFDWIEVRPYPINTNNQLNDDINKNIKNECWKEQRGKGVDFVIVSDLDEVLWSKNLYEELKFYKDKNFSIIKPQAYDFVSLIFPIHSDKLLHEQINTCTRVPFWDKCILFNPDLVEEISYGVGSHWLEQPKIKSCIWNSYSLYLFHFKYLSVEYLIMKRFATKNRISDINIENGWGSEYLYNKQQIEEQFNGKWNLAKDFSINNLLK